MHVLDDGAGPPLLLMAALGSNWFDLDPLVARLRDRWRVIRYDRPGYGLSERIPQGFVPTLIGEVDRMNAVLDLLGVDEPVTLVGHSMASFHVEAFARRYPERTGAVIMLDGSHVLVPWRLVPTSFRVGNAHRVVTTAESVTGRLGIRRWGRGRMRPRALPAPPEGFDDDQHRWSALLFGQPSMVLSTLAENAAFPAMHAELRLLRRRPLPEVPVVVVAALSGPAPWRWFWTWKQRRFAQTLGGRLVTVEPARHFLVLDRPDAVADVVEGVRDPGGG
ncbi:alpha/beta fold hydrolase [Gordonia sp. NPDC003424]